jgi:hypothetical protein
MGWSEKYKKSIDCDNPKGFSQKAHCQGKRKKLKEQLKPFKSVEQIAKKHRLEVSFIQKQLDMGEPIEHEHTKDHRLAMEIALQHLDEIPDYYTRLKKMETDAKKHHKKFKDVKEETKSGDEGLHDWFGKSKSSSGKKGWVQLGGKFSGKPCARQPGQTSTPKCGSSKMKRELSKDEEEAARRRKNRLDPNQPEKSGGAKPTNVRTEEMNLQEVKDKPGKGSGKKDACYSKVKSRYSVWPSAYASGALVKCRKVGAANWGTKTEQVNMMRYCPKCKKDELRDECKYGGKYWDMYSLPTNLSSVAMSNPHYHANSPHPANEEKDHEYSMARSEISTIIAAAKRLKKKMGKGEGNLEAWVQSKITKAADYIDAAADYVDSGEMQSENVSIEDANGKKYVQFIDIIRPQSLKPSVGIGSKLIGEGLSFEISGKKTTGMGRMTQQDIDRLKKGNPGASEKIDQKYQQIRKGISLPPVSKETYEPNSEIIGEKCWSGYKKIGMKKKGLKIVPNCVKEEYSNWREELAESSPAWQRTEGKNPKGGLNRKGIASYRRENPGSKLSMAVTTKPSKLKPGSKPAKRRKSFCARMGGMPGPMKDEKGRPTRKALSLRKWNC